MKRYPIPLFALSLLLLVASCGDKSSPEACQHATTMNLDAGNYDAVLQSDCATPMQLGAAWFGKAGYDATRVINSLIDAKIANDSGGSDLTVYMNSLTGAVTNSVLSNLDNARMKYDSVGAGSDQYKNAQFFVAIVDVVKAASVIKTVLDENGIGSLSHCDLNANGVSDEADATSCALLVSGTVPGSAPCSLPTTTNQPTYATTPTDIFFSNTTGTYRGFTITIPVVASDPSCTTLYKKTLYQSAAVYNLATTSGACQESSPDNTRSWPCPLTSSIDFVQTVQDSLNGSLDALSSALTNTSDVQQSIVDFQNGACGGDDTCTAAELANYIQNNL